MDTTTLHATIARVGAIQRKFLEAEAPVNLKLCLSEAAASNGHQGEPQSKAGNNREYGRTIQQTLNVIV